MTASKSVKAVIHNVAIASFNFAGSTESMVAAIQAGATAGMTQAELQHEFRGGRIAKAMLKGTSKLTEAMRDKAITKGIAISMACEPGRKAKQGQAMRTTVEQALFAPSKRWWSRMGRDAGVIKARAQGKRKTKASKAKAKAKAKPFIANKPKDAAAAMLTVQTLAKQLATYATTFHNLLQVDVVAVCNGTSLKIDGFAKAA